MKFASIFRSIPFVSALAVFIIIFCLYAFTSGFMKNQYDDSYITYRYAIHLAEGDGLVFNADERADAASSFLYTVVLAFFYKIGVKNLEFVATVIGIMSAIGIVSIVSKIILTLTKNRTLAFLAGVLIGTHGFISGWSISGMETIFFTFFVTLFIYHFYFQKQRNEFVVTLILVAVILIQIEGIILIFAWGLHSFVEVIHKKRTLSNFLSQCIVISSVLIGFYLFKYVYYGTLESNAVGFKRIATYYQPNIMHLLLSWGGTSLVVLSVALKGSKKFFNKQYWSLFVFIGLSIISFLIGPHSDGARYTVHILPFLFIFAFSYIALLLKGKNRKFYYLGIILCIVITSQTVVSSLVVRSFMVRLMQGQECRSQVGIYLSNNLQKGVSLLSGDVGMIAYRAKDQNIIDLSGLTSKDILNQYKKKETIDSVLIRKHPEVLADTFFMKNNTYKHLLLTNQVEHVIGMKNYSTLFTSESFQKPLYTCTDGERRYAVFSLKKYN